MQTSITFTIEQIINEARPDLPFRWVLKFDHNGACGTQSSCVSTRAEAKMAIRDAIAREMRWM